MNREDEELRRMLIDCERAESKGAADGEHLRDEDFMKLAQNKPAAKQNGNSSAARDILAPRRKHLADCEICLKNFKDFYAFFAPAEPGEAIASREAVAAAWKSFAPRVTGEKSKPKFWAWLFPAGKNPNFSAALGWSLAAILSVLTGFGFYAARQAQLQNSQLAGQLENQKQTFEERLKNLENLEGNDDESADQEKTRLVEEKAELQKQIAELQTAIGRAKQPGQKTGGLTPSNLPNAPKEKSDETLVAINTPIYDVYPGDTVVRSGEQSANKLLVPNNAKSVVLILNAAGRADFPAYQVSLSDNSGKTIWRGGGLRKDKTGGFTLTLARSTLKNGTYRLKLFSGATAVAEYPITIEIGK
jgi:hypothetical protein